MLFFLVGGVFSQTVTTLYLDGGNNVTLSNKSYDEGNHVIGADVYFGQLGINQGNAGLTGTNWIASYNEGEIHTFTITLSEAPGSDNFSIYIGSPQWDFNNVGNGYEEHVVIAADKTTASISISKAYEKVYIFQTTGSNATLKIASITRTISTPSSVIAPTIDPASGTYDGNLSVRISKGEGNTAVAYKVTGADGGDINTTFTAEELTEGFKVLNLTGSSTITVTATGYDGENASSEVANTYTHGIPNGKETATVTYYQIVPLTMSDGTSPAYFDFEDGTTLITGTSNIDGGKLSIVDCDESQTTRTGSTKCMKVDLSDKDGTGKFYDVQVQLVFNTALEQNKQYQVRFWTKANTYVNNETRVRFQENGNDWTEYNRKDITYNTYWTEYSYDISANGNDCTMMVFDLGKVANNTIYLDDVVVYDVTNGNTPVEFTSRLGTAVVTASAIGDYAVGDYVLLNITGTPTEIGYKTHATNDEQAIYLTDYTALSQTNGNWLIPVTSDIKNNGLSIKGYNMTLNSVDLYKKEAISEAENNTISSKEDHVVVELTRSFVAGTWNTVCLPFTLTSDQATQLFGSGYKLAQFTGVSGTTMQFTTTDSFVAGVPYLVKPTIDVSNASPVVLVDVSITAKTPQTVTYGGYSFVGNFTQKTFSGNECSTSRFVATGNELMTPNDGSTLKSLRCYFTVAASARALSFDVDEEGNTTAVADINRETITNKCSFFNLAGQRVAKPTKGLYIVNGKKVVIK